MNKDGGVVILKKEKMCDGSKPPCWLSTLLHVLIVISMLGVEQNNRGRCQCSGVVRDSFESWG